MTMSSAKAGASSGIITATVLMIKSFSCSIYNDVCFASSFKNTSYFIFLLQCPWTTMPGGHYSELHPNNFNAQVLLV